MSIFVVMMAELTNTVFVNSTNMTTNIETAVLSRNKETEVCEQTYYDRLELIEGESWCIETIDSILAKKRGFKKVRQGGLDGHLNLGI